jgi:hypothetical protein
MYLGKVTGDSQQYNFHNEQVRLHLGKSKKKQLFGKDVVHNGSPKLCKMK